MSDKLHDVDIAVHQPEINEKDFAPEAQVATAKEHALGLRQALKAYPKAILWSIALSSAVIMEGYDTLLVRLVPFAMS